MKAAWVLLILMVSLLMSGGTLAAQEGNETSEAPITVKIQTFQEFEKSLKSGVGNIIKKILPYMLRGGSDVEISGPCMSSVMRIIGGVRQLKEWAMRFIDATGKIPPGILEGTTVSLGDYDECLEIEVGKKDEPPKTPEQVAFRGQYCLLEIHRPEALQRELDNYYGGDLDTPIAKSKTFLNMFVRYKNLANTPYKVGACVPSKCSQQDIENILSSETFQAMGKITISNCETNEGKETSVQQLLFLCIIGFIVICMILGTAVDMFFRCCKKEKEKQERDTLTYTRAIVNNTSLYNNAINVLSTENNHESLSCLCGLRPIVVVLTIYSHTYGHLHSLHFQKFSKAANFMKFFENFFFSGIANGSVIVDSIFFIAAVTISYNAWKFAPSNGKIKVPIFKTLIQRYCRFSAAQLLTISLFLLFPLIGSGPLWYAYTHTPLKMCRQKWWFNFLYIHNTCKPLEVCLYHTWVLAVIMQLTILGLIVMWILNKSRAYGILSVIIIILAGMIGVGVMIVIRDVPAGLAFFLHSVKTFPIAWTDIYSLPYDHMGPFCIGILAGYFLATKKNNLEISKMTSILLWFLSVGCSSAVLFGLYGYRHGETMDVPLSVFYAITHRNVWALGIAWLVIACSTHHGGPVSRVLKSKFFVPLDRLCYMAYMLHMPIMFYHSGVLRERWFMGHLELFYLAIAYAVVSFIASFLVHITFVSAYNALENQVCSGFRRKHQINFESKSTASIQTTSAITLEENTNKDGLINTAYC